MIPTYVFIIMCLFNKILLTQDVNHGYKCLHVPSIIYVVSLSASYSTLHGANQLPNETRQARSIVFWGKKGESSTKSWQVEKKSSHKITKTLIYKGGRSRWGRTCTVPIIFTSVFFHFTKKIGGASCPPPPPIRMLHVPVWCPAFFFISDCKFRFIHTLRRYGCTSVKPIVCTRCIQYMHVIHTSINLVRAVYDL